jgi:RNA polymerase sigma factor (sigma-70 family)
MVATLTAAETVTAERRITADELCRLYAREVCRFAAMMSTTASDADDLAQEALLRAVRGLSSYNPARGSMVAWLWRIVSNAAKDAAGRRQRIRDLVIRIGIATPRVSETVEERVLIQIRDAKLHVHVRSLPLRDRTLIALRYGVGLDTRDVAGAMGLSPESTAKAIRRALARLRARLEASEK